MFDEDAEIRLSPGGRTIRVLRSWMPGARDGRRISPTDAASIARALLSRSATAFGFRDLVQSLCTCGRDPRPALERLLIHDFVMIELADARGVWDGPGVRARPEPPDPELERASRRGLTWVAVTVVDGDEPERSFAGSQFRLRLPDGSLRADALDGGGGVRVDDIEAGMCWFELTDVPRTPGSPQG